MRSAPETPPSLLGRLPSWPSLMAIVEMPDMGVPGPEFGSEKLGAWGRLINVAFMVFVLGGCCYWGEGLGFVSRGVRASDVKRGGEDGERKGRGGW